MGLWKRRVAGSWIDQTGRVIGSVEAMQPHEMYHWQVRAALLDPAAYGYIVGSGVTATVPVGQTWYVVNGWNVDEGTPTAYHRKPDALTYNNYALVAGETITLESVSGAFALICKPETVIATDDRYTTDPKALFYERLYRADVELAKFKIGMRNTGTGNSQANFPTDFAEGLILQVSTHDTAWTILRDSAGAGGVNLNHEVSDTDRFRVAERIMLPFDRATFPKIETRGVGQAEGSVNVRYVKLPSDW